MIDICSIIILLRDGGLSGEEFFEKGMEKLTGLGKAIIGTDSDKIRLDQAVKNILAYKPLLARIFKEVVEECHDMSYEEIESCIEGDVLVSKVYVAT